MDCVKSEDLIFIERYFMTIKEEVAVSENLGKIENVLNRLFDLNTHISIVQNTTNEFFGMNIFPEADTLDKIVENIITNQCKSDDLYGIWSNNPNWYIEIDSMLLSSMEVNASPSEITSVLLNEISRTIYSNTIPDRLFKVLCYKLLKLKTHLRQLIKTEKIRKLFNIAVLECCLTKNFNYLNETTELDADKFIINHGYKDDFNNFINRLIKTTGTSSVNRKEFEIEREIDAIINWSIVNIKELEFRKTNLKVALKTEMLKTPSLYVKRIIQDIYVSFFGENIDKYRELLSEQYMETPTDIYSELQAEQCLVNFVKKVLTEASGNIFDKRGRLKTVTQSDIDILTVESEKIDTVDDKIYLLDKLYRYYELVVLGLEYIESSKGERAQKVSQSKATLLNMKNQLDKLRDQIMATKIIEKDYGVFIRYPKGYQG